MQARREVPFIEDNVDERQRPRAEPPLHRGQGDRQEPGRQGHHQNAREDEQRHEDNNERHDEAPRGHNARNAEGRQQFGDQRPNRPPQREGFRPAEVNLHFTKLKDLKSKDPAEVLTALSYCKEGLKRLLVNEQKLTSDADMTKLLLNALAKVCQCNSMPTQQHAVLNVARDSGFLRVLGPLLTIHGVNLSQNDVNKIIGDSADIARTLLNLFASVLPEVVMVYTFIEMTIKRAEAVGHELDSKVLKKVEELEVAKTAGLEGLQRKITSANPRAVDEDSQTPPDDFRALSVFPTMEDLNKDELPFLRKNKATGRYRDLDHYLDVQFRLLREDFVYPLREGIRQYLEMIAAPHRGRKLKDIRVYHSVHILRAVCLQGSLGHRLNFDVSRMKRVRWEVSKRLIYGSLVCLSADNFQTLFFATVSNRDSSDLKEGIVDVSFEHNLAEISAIRRDTEFTMAETTAFFEAYRHVLAGLQTITRLPFDKYIVQCQKQVADPAYLADSRKAIYDLRPLVDTDIILREDRKLEEQGREVGYDFSPRSRPAEDISILQREEWPDHQLLELDMTQFDALNQALTKEFTVIQGPPGTGKTYVGLKIVKALLHNRKSWDPTLESCMLIVCYTNHALDQFLEGVVSFFKGQVVRVGNRSRSEELQKYNLNNLRWEMRKKREDRDRDFSEITRLRFQGHEAMDTLKAKMDTIGMKIEGAKLEVLNEDVLQPYILEKHYDRLQDARDYLEQQQQGFMQQGKTKKRVFCMLEWLGIGSVLQAQFMTPQAFEALNQELGEDELEIEGEVQAMEDRHRLDTDDAGERNEKKKTEKKKALAEQRSQYLALDVSKLDHNLRDNDNKKKKKKGGGQEDGFQIPAAHWRKIKRKLRRNVGLDDRMTEDEERMVHDIWMLNMNEKWRMYRLWTHKLCSSLQEDMRELEQLYDELARRQKETLMQEDKHILKKSTVIAMTTTAAARYQSILQEIKPKVVVVEEAAEVLEGHVITTLSQECQHLILIGDHKQLRPNPTVYKLAKKYNLELSLFERMIDNGLRCVTLGYQHRMRPEIAELVKPIYPQLNNHPSVEKYEDVKGISSNVFFINHNYPESHDDETKSHSNEYEAHYMSQLVSYLLKQGYDPSRITVLTTYSGQLFLLKKWMPKKWFDGVRLTVVDNFQGEENDIIVLSLVRSNPDDNIGFLKTDNRVCVALSRAKIGLFVIGNFDIIRGQSNLWTTIIGNLEKKGRLGEALHLYCQNHPDDAGLVISTPDDFANAPEGGCMKPCTTRLDCGHVCTRMCHPADQEHKEYNCIKPCERKLSCEFKHSCKKLCYLDCGECTVLVERVLPRCGHTGWMQCSTTAAEHPCTEPCTAKLSCGHTCGDLCGQPHKCYEKVEHAFPCGHKAEIYCNAKLNEKCPVHCKQQLCCGHTCDGKCGECFSGRLHRSCGNRCTRILVCGHECQDSCSNCPPCKRRCENRCVHSMCTKKCGKLCAPCREPCTYECPHHRCRKLCSEPCDRPPCSEPCPQLLDCNHPCIGVCGEPCPTLCRICNRGDVTDIFFGTEEDDDALFVQLEDCGHVLEVSGLDQWMETTTSEKEDSIQLKACPKCKVPIRRNLRYGSKIKQQLLDIEQVKGMNLPDEDEKERTTDKMSREVEKDAEPVRKFFKQRVLDDGDTETQGGLVCMQNQMQLIDETYKLREFFKKKDISSKSFPKAVKEFEEWICKPRLVLREQEVLDAQDELSRLKDWLSLLFIYGLAKSRKTVLPELLNYNMKKMIFSLKDGLVYTKSQRESTKTMLKELRKLVPESGLGISDEERVMILQAMALNQGHWYKCQNGHVYAIGDCGGANQESRCPECNQTIGGSGHRLAAGNAVATEMDGARHAAWSEQNNMENFGFNEL